MARYSADFIFTGSEFLPPGSSIVLDAEGTILAVDPESPVDTVHLNGLLMPGLVNAHCHLELSYLKGKIKPHTGLPGFLNQVNAAYTAPRYEQEIQQAMQAADQDMFAHGIVAVGDISNRMDSITIKKNSPIHYVTFVEAFGVVEENATQRFSQALKIRDAFRDDGLTAHLAPHAPYSVSCALFKLIGESGELLSGMHNQECAAENELFELGTGDFVPFLQQFLADDQNLPISGKTSLQTRLPYLDQIPQVLLVHNAHTSEEDLEFASKSDSELFWCFCPQANLYIESKPANPLRFVANNLDVVVGTDSLASNHTLDLFEEIRLLQNAFPTIPLAYWLQSVTVQGARALLLDAQFGSLHVGSQPGVVHIPEWQSKDSIPETRSLRFLARPC